MFASSKFQEIKKLHNIPKLVKKSKKNCYNLPSEVSTIVGAEDEQPILMYSLKVGELLV